MCRVQNPSFGDYYMKDWFIRDDCIRIFNSKTETEIAMLHSEYCIETMHCSDLPPELYRVDRFVDENSYAHMPTSRYISEGDVNWAILKKALID